MPDFELTPAQQKALDTSKNVAVTAGAGSGKTGVLVERYIKSLQDDASIGTRNVLAITFTDKAAAEMKARVRDELEKRIKRAKDAVRWRDVLDTLDRAAISTIHSFCGALLREHPIEAEIDPLFETLDESESGRLRDQAVEDALQGAGDDDALRSHAQVLLRNWPRQRATDNIRMLLGGSGSHDEWAAFYRDADDETIRENIRTRVEKEVAQRAKKLFSREMIRRLAAFTCTKPDKIEQVRQETLDALHGGLLDTENVPDLVESLTAITLRGGSARNWDDFDGCKKLLGEIRNSAKELAALAVGETDWNAIPVLRALSTLYTHSREIYEQYKGGGRALDFDDLQTRTLQLLKQNKGNIRRELHRRFHAVLVDEFQDTNHLQWEIIRLIVEPPDGSIPPGKLFIVGDPKQSIYGFRNAEIRVFADVKNHCIEGPGQVEMDDNFRSAPAVVAFVNRLMPGLMGATGLTYDPDYRELVCRLHTSLEGSVALLLPQKATAGERNDDEPHAAETEAELVARQLQHFVQSGSTVWDKAERAERPARYGDMAILLRARTRLGLFEEALRKVDIPFTVAGGFEFYERQEVLDVVNVLRFLLHQGDDVALAAVLRSPMAGISDDALYRISRATGGSLWAKLQNIDATPDADDTDAVRRTRNLIQTWLRWSRRMPVAELLAHVLEDTALWGAAAAGERGPQAIANIEKMLGLARGAPDLAGLVARLNTAISSGSREADAQTEPDESDAVKLLTIHAAKGLEFPIVCLPDTAAGVRHASASDVYTHRDYGFGIKARDADANIENTVIRTLIAQRTADEEKAESARLLYVALTRARDHLVISGSCNAGKPPRRNTWLSAIYEQLEIDPHDPRDVDDVAVHTNGSRIDVAEAPHAPGLDELLERYREAGERLRSKSGAAGGQPGLLGPVAGVRADRNA
ncbi:MAG: UvrD-helicase domain-containing protein, partial [Planctomycetes bacterium]|nr:UvrD-helicase domain-containing protein [Planctomycetota bacterium]